MKRAVGVLLSAALTWLVAPHLFAEFAGVRHKIVRTAMPVTGDRIEVPISVESKPGNLSAAFVAISRIHNGGTAPLAVRVRLDDHDVCSAEIPGGKSRRLNCPIGWAWWAGTNDHRLEFSASGTGYTVESFELATHYGALSPGPRDLIVGPPGMAASRTSPAWQIGLIFILLTLSVWSLRDPRMPRWLAAVHLTVAVVVLCLIAIAVLATRVSQYSLLISDGFLDKLLLLTAAPAIVGAASAFITWLRRSRWLGLARLMTAGLIVGAIFWSFVSYRTDALYAGNVSGPVSISHYFFDQSPMADMGVDVTRRLSFSDGNGYDGQFFYYMAFDPFLRTFRAEPKRYQAFIDSPPYRYGRIGFSLLTKILSGDRPSRYPITMIALLIVALAVCGALLGAIARHFGSSEWFGLLVLFVPGFWRSVGNVVPEPVAIAFLLAAYLCCLRRRWLACGAFLGLAMLVRETGGALVLAVIASVWLAEKRREAFLVAALAFVPILLWKCFVGWVFWSEFGLAGLMPHPDDVGIPLAGVWELWSTVARSQYFVGWPDMIRSAVVYPIVTTAAAAVALFTLAKRPSPMTAAAVFYGLLVITFNYHSVWLAIPNAERLSVDLFVALLLVFAQRGPSDRGWRTPLTMFWCATACYVIFGMADAEAIRQSVLGRILPGF